MKQTLTIIICSIFLSCGSGNNNTQGKRDTVVIIQQPPEQTRQEATNNKQTKVKNKEITYTADTTAPAVDYSAATIIGFDESKIIGKKNIQLQTYNSDCTLAANGDIRNEEWVISKQSGSYILKVYSETKTIEKYTGTLKDQTLIFKGTYTDYLTNFTSKATITLEFDGETKFSGKRHLITENSNNQPCEIDQFIIDLSSL